MQTWAGTTWATAQPLRLSSAPISVYGRLRAEGDSQFYRISASSPTQIRTEIGTPISQAQFEPRLVLYQADGQTIGPSLPMDQPPKTLALVYSANNDVAVFEALTQIAYRQKLNTTVFIPTGTSYLAVYDASPHSGNFRLTVTAGPDVPLSWSDTWNLLPHWWHDQVFAGVSWRTLFTPALLVVLMILAVEQLRFHRLHHLAPTRQKAGQKLIKKSTR